MKIAIDYDSTYSADPECFEDLISVFHNHGHKTYIVTARDELSPVKVLSHIPILYTAGEQKELFCKEKKLDIDIWIDDNPRSIPTNQRPSWGEEFF